MSAACALESKKAMLRQRISLPSLTTTTDGDAPKLCHLVHDLIESREDVIRELYLRDGRATRGGVAYRHALLFLESI